MVGIPLKTFRKYATGKLNKRHKLGGQVGRNTLLSKKECVFFGDVLARADRGDEGKSCSEAIDLVQEVNQNLTRPQASRQLTDNILRKNEMVKNSLVKSTATTTIRSAITVEQQFRWFYIYDACLTKLRESNKGLCKKSGKMFGEVIQHFRKWKRVCGWVCW